MKNKILLLITISFVSQFIQAQTAVHRFAIDLSAIKNEYNGDFGNGIFEFNKKWYPAVGLTLSTYLTPSFDLGLQGSFGKYGYIETKANQFAGTKLDGSVFIHYKLNNGYILKRESKLSPFISFGYGMASYGIDATVDKSGSTPGLYPTIVTKGNDQIIPVGAGLKYQISNRFAIQYQYLYNFTNNDIHDENRGHVFFGTVQHPASKAGNDLYGQHLFSISFNFGKLKDKNKTEKTAKLNKKKDISKNAKVQNTNSLIDTDGDGVTDNLDKCPETPSGVKVDSKGCPIDSDGDGVPDYLDKCPDVKGIAANKGCPELNADVEELFIKALQGVQFESDKYIIKKASFPILNQIVDVMIKNPSYILEINGHTDSTGDDIKNLKLSQNRADAIKEYLKYKGLDTSRLKANGFGETVPVAENSTKEGREKNRRVEFKIIY